MCVCLIIAVDLRYNNAIKDAAWKGGLVAAIGKTHKEGRRGLFTSREYIYNTCHVALLRVNSAIQARHLSKARSLSVTQARTVTESIV
jgi:hypothetical protein